MKNILLKVFSLLIGGYFLCSCEKEVDIKLKNGEEQIVVEGHIENGFPPYVILTNSMPYFSPVSEKSFENIFVHNANVRITNGNDTVTLREFSSDSLPKFIIDIISRELNIKLASSDDTTGLSLFVYLPTRPFIGIVGGVYNLFIQANGKELSATTTIPKLPKLDSLWTTPHPNNDTLMTLNVRITDPAGENNYVRYFTRVRGEPFYPPFFQSVLDDKSIFDVDGKTFDFPIEKGHNRNYQVDFQTFSYFSTRDTITVKWCAIDKEHFDFWSTAEFDRGSTGNPFSAPTRIRTNINGGFGIWGGYGAVYRRLPSF